MSNKTFRSGNRTKIFVGLIISLMLLTNITSAYKAGDCIQTTATAGLNVRDGPGMFGTNIIGTESLGSLGLIIGGPRKPDNYIWYKISYNDGITGWSAANWLTLSKESCPI